MFFGKEINGAKGWILGIQPAEFAKIAVIITLASFFAKKQERQTPFFTRDYPPYSCCRWIDGINFITKGLRD
ncbi:FtsW/RodA/SpoVE family cell cycle protein [Bacillus pacificus]